MMDNLETFGELRAKKVMLASSVEKPVDASAITTVRSKKQSFDTLRIMKCCHNEGPYSRNECDRSKNNDPKGHF